MIKRIYIMKENGMLLYSKHFAIDEGESFDDNIIIGFFASIVNFSKEAIHSVIQSIDLGLNNKLVLLSNTEEKLIATAIVSSKDDNDLINKILQNIMADFITAFSPDYNPYEINEEEMVNIIEDNLSGKISRSLIIRLFLSWILLIPLAIFLTFLNITVILYYIRFIYQPSEFYTIEEIITELMPQAVLISLFIIITLFALPNFISGYITLNKGFMLLNSGLYLVIILLTYYLSGEQSLTAYIIGTYLPTIIFVSIVFAYLGQRLGLKKKIVKK